MINKELEFLYPYGLTGVSPKIQDTIRSFRLNNKVKYISMKDKPFFDTYHYIKSSDNNKYECLIISLFEDREDNILLHGVDALYLNAIVLFMMSNPKIEKYGADVNEALTKLSRVILKEDEIKDVVGSDNSVREIIKYIHLNENLLNLHKVEEREEGEYQLVFKPIEGLSISDMGIIRKTLYNKYHHNARELQEYKNYWSNDTSFLLQSIMIDLSLATHDVFVRVKEDTNVNYDLAERRNDDEYNHNTDVLNLEYMKVILNRCIGPTITPDNLYEVFKIIRGGISMSPSISHHMNMRINKHNMQRVHIVRALELLDPIFKTNITADNITQISTEMTGLMSYKDTYLKQKQKNPFIRMLDILCDIKAKQCMPSVRNFASFNIMLEDINFDISYETIDLFDIELEE